MPKLSQILRGYYLADGGNTLGYWSRWRTFCTVNQLTFSFDVATNTIDWASGIGDQWIRRINRICDLFDDGWIEHRSWPLAVTTFDTFRNRLAGQLVAEINRR
jgi:hypothetical protein